MPVRRNTGLATAASPKAPPTTDTDSNIPDNNQRAMKFTAVLDEHTATVFERVTYAMRRVGRLAGGRYPSRADVLRAVVALVDDDPALAERVAERIQADLRTRRLNN